MHWLRWLYIAMLLSLRLALPLVGEEPKLTPTAEPAVDYQRDIQPLLKAHCYQCHGPDMQESNFRLDLKKSALDSADFGEPAIVPGASAESPLIRYVSGEDEDFVMPPKGARLTAAQVDLLRRWIDQGATWPDTLAGAAAALTTDHWSFQPLSEPAVPALEDPRVVNPIDAFILERLHAAKLDFSPAADRRTQLRRLYLDMLGLPPTLEEITAFERDARPDAYARRVEQVLASPRYGERWGRHWLDVVRFAETSGFEMNQPRPNAWRFRDYVIDAFNRDTPYDQFILEQLAGDAFGADTATGFLVGGPWDQVKSPDINLTRMQRQDELADMVNTTGTTFLGLTMGCARCHNHKFDPILQKDFYAMQAVFAGVVHGDRELASADSAAKRRHSEIRRRMDDLGHELLSFYPRAFAGRTILIDEESRQTNSAQGDVIELVPPDGQASNPPGAGRGARDDLGDADRMPNVSGGRYNWWQAATGTNVLAYRPHAAGAFRLWLSWGCNHASHGADVQYLIDRDGDLATVDDQQLVATVDQRRFADGSGEISETPLWSGFFDAGRHEFRPESILVVRRGVTNFAVTADVVVLQEEAGEVAAQARPHPQFRAKISARQNIDRFAPVEARYVRMTITETSFNAPCLDEIEVYTAAAPDAPPRNVALAANGAKVQTSGDLAGNPLHRSEHLNDAQYGNARSWISDESGRGWIVIELPETQRIDTVVWQRDRQEMYDDRLVAAYTIETAVEPGAWRIVARSDDRRFPGDDRNGPGPSRSRLTAEENVQLDCLQAELDSLQAEAAALADQLKPVFAYAGNFQEPGPTHRLHRGDPTAPREQVAPDALTVLGTLSLNANAPERERRVALARWIASPDNPLPPRVIANRLWHYHFGTGLVDTPSDLGANGSPPTHPELLDWLAGELRRNQWSLKHLHRLILMSSVYRQSSSPRDEALQLDAGSRLLWRYPPRRLEAEAIRDSVLYASGALDLTMGGPGFSVFEPNNNYVRNYEPKNEFGPAEWRRMVYMTKVRMEQDATFGAFDSPDAGQVCPKRSRSTTALQALNLLNSDFMLQQADMLAERLTKQHGGPADLPRQIERAFEIVLGRAPDTVEAEAGRQFAETHGLPAFCRALLNCNELLFIP